MEAFASTLADHQKAKLEDNSTVLDRAVLEHNMLAISRLYDNISFAQLAELLDIEPTKVDTIWATIYIDIDIDIDIYIYIYQHARDLATLRQHLLRPTRRAARHRTDQGILI